MAEESNHISYSAADIEKYWKGQLSAKEMYALEKAALDDPFLADAIDGYRNAASGTSSIEVDIRLLKETLQQRVTDKKIVSLPPKGIGFSNWLKVAAVVVVMLGSFMTYRLLNSTSAEKNEAKNIAVVTPTIPTDTSTNNTTNSISTNNGTLNTKEELALDSSYFAKTDKTCFYKKSAIKEKYITPLSKDTLPLANDVLAKNNKEQEFAPLPSPSSKVESKPTQELAISTNETTNVISGLVVDQNNKPLKGATVRFPTLNQRTVTDATGKFNLSAADTVVTASVTHNGFQTQNLSLRNNIGSGGFNKERQKSTKITFNQVQLQPQNDALNEVVVSGYKNRRNATTETEEEPSNENDDVEKKKAYDINVLNAAPCVSWNEYNTYLEKNRALIDEVKNIRGCVIVAFTVTKNGIRNIFIEKKLNDYLDAEALRLVKEGPSWKLLKGKKARATVLIRF